MLPRGPRVSPALGCVLLIQLAVLAGCTELPGAQDSISTLVAAAAVLAAAGPGVAVSQLCKRSQHSPCQILQVPIAVTLDLLSECGLGTEGALLIHVSCQPAVT